MTTYGEASVVTEERSPHLDLSFVSPETMDELRREQYGELHAASFEALFDPDHWRDAITPRIGRDSIAQQRVIEKFDEEAAAYVEAHLENVPPDARDLVRQVAVPWVIKCSVHNMDDEEWYLGRTTPEGQQLPSGWEYLESRVRKLIATYEGTPEDDPEDRRVYPPIVPIEDEPIDDEVEREHRHRRLRDLPLIGAVAAANGFDRLRNRWRQRHEDEDEEHSRRWPYAVIAAGGLALAGAGLYLLLDRAGVAHHILATPHPGKTPHPSPPPSTGHHVVPPTGHHVAQAPRGTEVFGPTQTSELTRNWADGTNARHILHFVGERRGQVTLQLENVAPDGTIINGHAVDLTQAENLRANITVNVNGQLNTISVPMHGDSLELHGNLAKLIQSGKFSSVEVVRQHGDAEQVFSTVTGKGRSISARALRSYLNQVQQQVTSQGAGGNSAPHNIVTPNAPHKTPTPAPTITIRPEPNEAPGDDTGFWHNPVVDGVMIASGLAIAGGAVVAGSQRNRRTEEVIEEADEPQHVGLGILGADAVSLPQEREQEYAQEIQGILHSDDMSWLQPGRTREEYMRDFTPVAEQAVDELSGNISAGDRRRLVAHLVNEYCEGDPEEIYLRLSALSDSAYRPSV